MGRTDEERARWARNADEVENSVMAKLGYRELSDVGREHSFGKATLHFELHRSLLDAAELAKGQAYRSELDYYANPWNLAKPTETVPGEFRFDLADEYVFHIDHMSKHYRGSGFGLRFLADEYVYCMRFPDTVGSRLVAERLQKLGLDYFEHAVRELSVLIFRHPEDWRERVGTEELALLEDVLSGGTYGSLERRVGRRLAGAVAGQSDGKLKVTMDGEAHTHTFRYIRNRLFPPKAWVEAYYPAWSRNAFTRFLLLFHRIKEGLRERPALLRRELELLFKRR